MSWTRQVIHVLGKDLKEHRVLLGVFASLVLFSASLALLAASTIPDVPVGYSILLTLALHLLGTIIAASLVHADAPYRADAFWASRPLAPLAVLLAKLSFLLLAIVVPVLVAQLSILVRIGIPIGEAASTLTGSAIVLSILLTFGVLTATLTRDLSGVALLLVLAAVGGGALAFALDWLDVAQWRSWLFTPSMLLTFLVVGVCYQARRLDRAIRVAGLTALLGLTSAFGGPTSNNYPRGAEARATLPRSAARLDSTYTVSGGYDKSTLHLGLELSGITPTQRATLTAGTARLHLADGSVLSAPLQPTLIGIDDPALLPIPGIRWVREARAWPRRPARIASINVTLGPRQWRRLAVGVGRVDVEARIRIAEPRPQGSMPFRVGAMLRSATDRAEVEQIVSRGRNTEVRIRRIRVPSGDELALRIDDLSETGAEWALVNEAIGEGVLLAPGAGEGSSVAVVGIGASVTRARRTLAPRIGFDRRLSFDRPDEWYRDARLVRVGWKDRGEYTVRATTDLRGSAPRPVRPSHLR